MQEHPCPMDQAQWDYFGTGDMAIFCQVHRMYWLGFTGRWTRHRGDRPALTGPAQNRSHLGVRCDA